jgi:hypothetical protein
MADLGFSDLLTLVQTIAIIAALLVTLYFSQRQIRTLGVDLETRVLNDVDEKFHNIAEMFIVRPELTRLVYQTPEVVSAETPVAYYMMFFCAHVFHMRQRGVLADNEWTGWLQWMRNAFQYGTISGVWNHQVMAQWFDPAFRSFVETELLPASAKGSNAPGGAPNQGFSTPPPGSG